MQLFSQTQNDQTKLVEPPESEQSQSQAQTEAPINHLSTAPPDASAGVLSGCDNTQQDAEQVPQDSTSVGFTGVVAGFKYTQHDVEHLTQQFSRVGFKGIRSLPLTLEPDFRMRLYGTLVLLGKQWRARAKERSSRLALRCGEGDKDCTPVNLLAYGTLGPGYDTQVRCQACLRGVNLV